MLKKIILLWRYSCIYLWTLGIQKKIIYLITILISKMVLEETQSMRLFYVQKEKLQSERQKKMRVLYEMNEFKRNAVIANRRYVVVFLFFQAISIHGFGFGLFYRKSDSFVISKWSLFDICVFSLRSPFDTKFFFSFSITWIKNST